MSGGGSRPSAELLAGRRALAAVRECVILNDLAWDGRTRKWLLHLRLTANVVPHPLVPGATDWVVQLDDTYPIGALTIHPATVGGITQTFPHQALNRAGAEGSPSRTGHICVDSGVRALERHGFDGEPHDADHRLVWHVERSLDWLAAASRNDLVRQGEHFELPAFAETTSGVLAFSEDAASLERWQPQSGRWGLAEVATVRARPDIYAVMRFDTSKRELVHEPMWGSEIASGTGPRRTALWIHLYGPPTVEPYEAPTTFAALRAALRAQSVDWDAILKGAASLLRDGLSHLVLLGFPIPSGVGEPARQMHWQAFLVPSLARGKTRVPGFRPGPDAWARHDALHALAPDKPVPWIRSENWAMHDISTRGRFEDALAEREILLVGAGAVGSVLSELLVRGGAGHLTVMDHDTMRAGNLVRHTLTLADVGRPKATAVAARLNAASPHARAEAIMETFPPVAGTALSKVQSSQIVLDCTGSDDLLYRMASFAWTGDRLFVSVSLGLRANRMFVMLSQGLSFPVTKFVAALQPWLARDVEAFRTEELPREGLGCWHPMLPARIDHVWTMVGLAADEIALAAATPPAEPILVVYERRAEGIQRLLAPQTDA